MKRKIVTISENGSVTVLDSVQMRDFEIAELFGTKRPAITKHLKNIFLSGELEENMVCSILEHTTPHGAMADKTQTTEVKYYNLDAILSIGYRVNSKNATQFRIWANKVLKEYLIKGYAVKVYILFHTDPQLLSC